MTGSTSGTRGRQFSLVVPEEWSVHEDYEGTLVTAVEPPGSTGEQFAANVTVLRFPNERGLDIQGLLDDTVRQLSVAFADCVLLERSDDDGRLLFTYEREELGLTADQRQILEGNDYYVVTAVMTNARFAELSPITSGILDSFVFEGAQ